MSTICFDIKRVDKNYVCIQHCDINKFEYEYHLPFSYHSRSDKDGHDRSWLKNKKYRYVWLIVAKEKRTGIERIIHASNDKCWSNKILKDFRKDIFICSWNKLYENFRFIKLPFETIHTEYNEILKHNITFCRENDMKDEFKLYCPVKLNKKHHVYADCYIEIRPSRGKLVKLDGKRVRICKMRRFKWIAPKYLANKED